MSIEKVLKVAANEIGYLEKTSTAWLDHKTKNAGKGNYTKYWRDVKPSYQGQPWCACFVTWCLQQVYGIDGAKKALGHYPFVYCPDLANIGTRAVKLYTIDKCQPGDVVLFHNGKTYNHTGIVVTNDAGKITTIEGNTDAGNTIVDNGGGVARKCYTYDYIKANKTKTRFYRPDYAALKATEESEELTMTQYDELKAAIAELTKTVEAIAKENQRQNEVINAVGVDIHELQEGHNKQNEMIWDLKVKTGGAGE